MANMQKRTSGCEKKHSGVRKYPESQKEQIATDSLIMGDASLVPSNVKNPYTSLNIMGKKEK